MFDKLHKKRQRILALDLLRGLFLLVILADHLQWTPSLFFQSVTAYTGMIASAAEGFFVISGILIGYIYGPKILHSTRQTCIKIWKRGLLLYILAVAFTLFYTGWAVLLPDGYPRSSVPIAGAVTDAISGAFSLTYSYGWADFLSRYAVFMFAAPLALWLVAKRKAYIVLIVSGLIWLVFRETTPWLTFTAWQIIFFTGIVIGYYLPDIERELTKTKIRKRLLKSFVYTSILSFITVILFVAIPPLILLSFDTVINNDITSTLNRLNGIREQVLLHFDKTTMSAFRLLVGTIWFIGLYSIFRAYETTINNRSRGILLLFGQYSLFVYGAQAFLIFAIDSLLPAPSGPNPSNILINTILGIACAVVIYLATRLYAQRAKIYTRMKEALS